MEILKYVLFAVHVIICIALGIVVLMQSKEDEGASGTIMGASASNFYEKNKGKTREGKMKKVTITLGIAFAISTIVFGIIYAM